MFDFSPYGTQTSKEILKVVENLNLKNYTLLNRKCNKSNFFIWKKGNNIYLRLCLMSKGFHENKVFWWEIDFNFNPLSKKKPKKWSSEYFKGSAEDLYLNRFYEAVKQIKLYLKGK